VRTRVRYTQTKRNTCSSKFLKPGRGRAAGTPPSRVGRSRRCRWPADTRRRLAVSDSANRPGESTGRSPDPSNGRGAGISTAAACEHTFRTRLIGAEPGRHERDVPRHMGSASTTLPRGSPFGGRAAERCDSESGLAVDVVDGACSHPHRRACRRCTARSRLRAGGDVLRRDVRVPVPAVDLVRSSSGSCPCLPSSSRCGRVASPRRPDCRCQLLLSLG
jgi:hypothetical protein